MDDNANPIAISSRESNNEANRLEEKMAGWGWVGRGERRGEASSFSRGVIVQQCTLGGENTFGINGGQVGYIEYGKQGVRSSSSMLVEMADRWFGILPSACSACSHSSFPCPRCLYG